MKLKIITLNLFEGGVLMDNILSFLNRENADIIFLQEAYNSKDKNQPINFQTLTILKQNFPDYYFKFAPEGREILPNLKVEFGNLILSRIKITSHEAIFFDVPYDSNFNKSQKNGDFSFDPQNLQKAKITIGHKTITLLNIHGIWGFDGLDNPRRLKMGSKIINSFKNEKNIILGGDFNLIPQTKTIARIEKYLVNIFKNELKTTFNMKYKTIPGYNTAVVDMLFVSPQLKVVNHYCPSDDVSDHRPLVAMVQI